MFKNLLVNIPSEHSPRSVIDGAISLAARYQAQLDALSAGKERQCAGTRRGGAAATISKVEHAKALARAPAALASTEAEASAQAFPRAAPRQAGPKLRRSGRTRAALRSPRSWRSRSSAAPSTIPWPTRSYSSPAGRCGSTPYRQVHFREVASAFAGWKPLAARAVRVRCSSLTARSDRS